MEYVFFFRYYDNVAIASSTTSTSRRKSSHYHHNHNNSSRKSPGSPGLRKTTTNAVSYIYEYNSLRRHNLMAKQDSNLSQQMLLKQDSHGSRQYLIKQESASSDGSRRLLCQQDSNGSKMSLSKQDSVVSYCVESKRANTPAAASSAIIGAQEFISINNSDTISSNDSRRFVPLSKMMTIATDTNIATNNTNPVSGNLILEHKRQKFVKQDSVISFADQKPGNYSLRIIKLAAQIKFVK